MSVYAGTDPLSGKKRWHRKTVKGGEREAQIVLGKLLAEAEAGKRPDTRVTVAEAIAQYLFWQPPSYVRVLDLRQFFCQVGNHLISAAFQNSSQKCQH